MAEVISHHEIIRRAREEHGVDAVICGVSGGKDSLAVLDICKRHFSRVEGYFGYLVPGLEFQESYLRYVERKFAISIHRVPSPTLASWIRDGADRMPSAAAAKTRRIKRIDIENYLRRKLGIDWFATGEKCIDSIERNAMIRRVRGIDPKRRQIWPIAYWNDSAVFNHIKRRQILMPPDYRFSAGENYKPRSFGSMGPTELWYIREHYPEDFKKIVAMFPMIHANLVTSEAQRGQKEGK